MHMYAIGTLPLICKLPNSVQQIWIADDAAAGKQLDHLRTWWDSIQKMGPEVEYYSNAEKSWLIVKEKKFLRAESMFRGMGIIISVKGKKHFGAPLGNDALANHSPQLKLRNRLMESSTSPSLLNHSLMLHIVQ